MMKLKKTRLAFLRKTQQHPLPFVLVGVAFLATLSMSAIWVLPRFQPHSIIAPTPIPSHSVTHTPSSAPSYRACTLLIPANPLSAQGLATPYLLSATNPENGPCNEANPDENSSAFVQGVIYDPAAGAFSVYSPLVIDAGTRPAIAPTLPVLPRGAVVALWFGFNGDILTLQGATGNTLKQTNCVNGLPDSAFGQFAYCNAATFFQAVNQGIAEGKAQVPTLGVGNDGLPCPTVRDFRIVDEDQADGVQTRYLANANGQTAQFSTANQAHMQNTTTLMNPSDNATLAEFIDPALGCTPWTVPDLVNNNTLVSALPLDEIMASVNQQPPVALVPISDPWTLKDNNPSLQKTNLYRIGVDQPLAQSEDRASTTAYCRNLIAVALPRLQLDKALFQSKPSPDGASSNSLFTYLASRLHGTLSADGLNCVGLLNMRNPITLATDGNGFVLSATLDTGK